MEDKKYKIIKTNRLKPGISNSGKFIGKDLQSKLNAGKVIEVNLEQFNQLKKNGWATIYKETDNVESSKTKKDRNTSTG